MPNKVSYGTHFGRGWNSNRHTVSLWDASTRVGTGALDFFDYPVKITPEVVEKWWCLGDNRNRTSMWVQGIKL